MEAGMLYDLASLEAKILSLDVKSMMVLSMLHKTTSDEEIIRWSGAWNYTQRDITRALNTIFKVLDLEHVPSKQQRTAAAKLFVTYTQLRHSIVRPAPTLKQRNINMDCYDTLADTSSDITIDVLSPVAARIAKLTPKRKNYVRCLVEGMDTVGICAELGLTEASVIQYKSSIFSELQLTKSLGIKNRMNILKQAWDLHNRTKKAPIAESTTKPPPEIMARITPQQDKPAVAHAEPPKSDSPSVDIPAGVMPVVFFADPASIIGVELIPVSGTISTEMLADGYRCEALIASQQRGSAKTTAFLVMVLRM